LHSADNRFRENRLPRWRGSVDLIGGWLSKWLSIPLLIYLFFLGISLLGSSLKLLGGGMVTELLSLVSNPFIGLFVGILATSIVQSSSWVTSVTVALVAGGGLDVSQAIPIIMGSNMGTSVTNALVAAGNITRPAEFRRAFAAAVVDDFFEICCIIVLFPLQVGFNVLGASAAFLSARLEEVGGLRSFDALATIVDPVIELLIRLTVGSAIAMLLLALCILFFSILFLVRTLRRRFMTKAERLFDQALFKTAPRAMTLGFAVTAVIQSSSITTSLAVPLAGGGFLTLRQIFPYILGANVGTTLTAIIAALATADEAAITVAFAHLLYNVFGIALVWPIRFIPIGLAERLAKYSIRSRLVPLAYVVLVFFFVPAVLIFSTR
jgi:sodium-dependent phosphate cotransporter